MASSGPARCGLLQFSGEYNSNGATRAAMFDCRRLLGREHGTIARLVRTSPADPYFADQATAN